MYLSLNLNTIKIPKFHKYANIRVQKELLYVKNSSPRPFNSPRVFSPVKAEIITTKSGSSKPEKGITKYRNIIQ
jgi:hypothetical protein